MTKLSPNITPEELMNMDYHYSYCDAELIDDWIRLQNTDVFKKGSQFRPGVKLCHQFCPNFFTIQNNKGLSFTDAWQNQVIMAKVLQWGKVAMSNLWMSWIRRAVYMVAGLPNSTFYRPHFSRQITMLTEKDKGVLFDPCFGWGGRMLGTISNGWEYIGCDSNKETFDNVSRMLSFVEDKSKSPVPRVTLLNIPAETFDFENQKKVDVVLTSPPYFDLEVYTDEDTQSYNKHNSYETWRDEWLAPLITNCLGILEDDGLSAWNVMNFKKNDLVGDVEKIHNDLGWELVQDTVGFNSPLANMRNIKNKDVTYIFRKKS